MVQASGPLLLPDKHADESNAARVAHLLVHRVDALDVERAAIGGTERACDEFVERAKQSERRARAVEDQIREAFGLRPLSDITAVELLGEAYRERCRQRRASTPLGSR